MLTTLWYKLSQLVSHNMDDFLAHLSIELFEALKVFESFETF